MVDNFMTTVCHKKSKLAGSRIEVINHIGSYEIEWNASGFASGVYFYKLSVVDKFLEVKNTLLIK